MDKWHRRQYTNQLPHSRHSYRQNFILTVWCHDPFLHVSLTLYFVSDNYHLSASRSGYTWCIGTKGLSEVMIYIWASLTFRYMTSLNQWNGRYHYIDVIMTTVASQITSLTIVYSIVYSAAHQRKHQRSASLAFVRGIHRDRWIPRTKGQLRGKCFHLMTSSCKTVFTGAFMKFSLTHTVWVYNGIRRTSNTDHLKMMPLIHWGRD